MALTYEQFIDRCFQIDYFNASRAPSAAKLDRLERDCGGRVAYESLVARMAADTQLQRDRGVAR